MSWGWGGSPQGQRGGGGGGGGMVRRVQGTCPKASGRGIPPHIHMQGYHNDADVWGLASY